MTEPVKSFKDLLVWQQAMDLAVAVYEVSASWPKEEMYGLTSQARRSAVSIPSNIAEGYGRETRGHYIQFLRVAQGSVKELETQVLLIDRIGMANGNSISSLLQQTDSVGKLLRLLSRRLSED